MEEKATVFADGFDMEERDVGNISFLSDISPGDQDQLNNLQEPVQNETGTFCSTSIENLKTGMVEAWGPV